jgi:benzylsuccinate CoA-transferase BbsF subunit
VTFLGQAVLDYTTNGRIAERDDNRHPKAAPHGAYRCNGDDRWCAIAVFTEEEWDSFCRVIGSPAWCRDAKFAILKSRKENEDELNRLVEEWTSLHSAEDVMAKMQAGGVAAGVVQNGKDLLSDPQAKHRLHYLKLDCDELGDIVPYDAPPFRLSQTPHELTCPPRLGEHTEYVLREMLGMSDEEFIDLLQSGALE